jgi:hypothetical protein
MATLQPPPGDRNRFRQMDLAPEADKREIKRKIKLYTILSFVVGLPGLALQIMGRIAMVKVDVGNTANPTDAELATLSGGCLLSLAGLVLFTVGLGFAAAAKGRNLAYGLFGLLSCIGLLILHFIGKICFFCKEPASYSAKVCMKCKAPLA